MSFHRSLYLQPSVLCDFDRSEELRAKSAELTAGCKNRTEKFKSIFAFVKAMPYTLEDWDVKASVTLQRGWGMCSGKTNLLVALLRSAGIPARYRVFQIISEADLWKHVMRYAGDNVASGNISPIQDHVDCEVWLDRWIDCDPSRDPAMERGLSKIGASLERVRVKDADGKVHCLHLALIDDWASQRQEHRQFRSDREGIFSWFNRGIESLRNGV